MCKQIVTIAGMGGMMSASMDKISLECFELIINDGKRLYRGVISGDALNSQLKAHGWELKEYTPALSYPHSMGVFKLLVEEFNKIPGQKCGTTPDKMFWIEFNGEFTVNQPVSDWTLKEYMRVYSLAHKAYAERKANPNFDKDRNK